MSSGLSVRAAAWVAVLLVAIASARIVSTYTALSHTMDEPIHLGAGMQWLTTGEYKWDPSHPPLARAMSAAAVWLGGERMQPADGALLEGVKLLGHDEHYDRVLAIARLSVLPLFWVACAVVWLWAYRIAGSVAAVASTLLFTLIPPVLAHAGLVTTDMAATAFCGAVALASLWWAEWPTRARSVVFGIVLGLGVLSKMSFLVYTPATWALFLLWGRPRWKEVRARVSPALIAALVACFVVWAGYRFAFAFPLPAPKFWEGIALLWKHNAEGHVSYIHGERHTTGVWYFFPITLEVKTPLALFALVLVGLWVGAIRWWRGIGGGAAAYPFLFGIAILLIAMRSRINVGVRHVLPIYIAMAIIAGIGAADLWRTRARFAVIALACWMAVSGALAHPDYLSYTNEITRGRPEAWVAESDLDWGQDMHRVGDFLRAHGAKKVSFTPYCVSYLEYGHKFPDTTPSDWFHPAPGWNVISLSGLEVFNHPGWAEKQPPQYRIGRTHWAWYFPEP